MTLTPEPYIKLRVAVVELPERVRPMYRVAGIPTSTPAAGPLACCLRCGRRSSLPYQFIAALLLLIGVRLPAVSLLDSRPGAARPGRPDLWGRRAVLPVPTLGV
jgi:hypothetical protein